MPIPYAARFSGPWPLASVLLALLLLVGCGHLRPSVPLEDRPSDPEATREAQALYANLKKLAPEYVLFGHQDDLAYGVTWKREPGRSDVKEVAGAYPAVFGWEIGNLELGDAENLDGVNFEEMQRWIRQGYEAGAVITISWHMNNPASGGNAWDPTPAVSTILPGGMHHDQYVAWLDTFATFVDGIKVGRFQWLGLGRPVPIIFRPFHEHTGSWFWWGGENVSPEDYKTLWRFTVDYLRQEKGLHQLLYAYSTDVFDTEAEYFAYYPGDDYVDIFGYDDYQALRTDAGVADMTRRLRLLVQLAEARGKVPALTETGLEGVPVPTWWTERLLRAIAADPVSRRIAYAHVWRNANEADMPGHHFGPYAGHPSAPDFVRFYDDPLTLFADGLPNLYRP